MNSRIIQTGWGILTERGRGRDEEWGGGEEDLHLFVYLHWFSLSLSLSLSFSLSPSLSLSSCELSDEGRYVIMYIFRGAEPKNKLYYCDLEAVGYKIEGEWGKGEESGGGEK